MSPIARICAAAAASAVLASGVAFAQDNAVTANKVIATVNGTAITLGHMIALRLSLPAQYQSLPDEILFNGILDQLINQQIMMEQLSAPTPAERVSLENNNRALAASLMVDRILAGAVNEDAVKAAYEARFAGAVPEQEYNASHILVETQEEAVRIMAALKEGAKFDELAKALSLDPGSAQVGGLLGWFPKGMMVKPFEDAVVAATVGEVTGPIQSPFGWHLIMVNETRMRAAPPLEDVREEIEKEVRSQTLDNAIAEAMARSQIVRESVEGLPPSILRNEALLGN